MKKNLLFILLSVVCLLASAQEKRRPTVGLVLSGGAAKGFAHVGILKVFENAGIYPDYIAGTSMGSLVGGLYAAGVRPDELVQISEKQNWGDLLTDKLNRKEISVYEKNEADRIFLPVTIKNKKITFTAGVSTGQKVQRLLSDLTWNVYKVNDFSQLQVPFFCAATDLVHNKVSYLDNGSLPDAIRSSISIPTMFNPEYFQKKHYVDGGLIDNMPVMEMKRRFNPDYIIAVDVGYTSKDSVDVGSFTSVLEQCIFMMSSQMNEMNRKAADYLIVPDLHGYGSMNFNGSDSLIRYGEIAAVQALPKLKALIDTLNSYPAPQRNVISLSDSIYIDQLEISGLKKISKGVLISKMGLKIPGYIKRDELEEAFSFAYGSLLFYSLEYNLAWVPGTGTVMTIKVEEKDTPTFSIGLHYDNEFGADVLFGTSLMNKMINGSKLTFELMLGGRSRITVKYNIYSWNKRKIRHRFGFRPDLGIRLDGSIDKYYTYFDGQKVSAVNYSMFSADVFAMNNFSNTNALFLGVNFEVAVLKASINPFEFKNTTDNMISAYLNYQFDNQDNHSYPSSGHDLNIESRIIYDFKQPGYYNFFNYLSYDAVIPCGKIFAILTEVNAGTVSGKNVPIPYMFYLGGSADSYRKGIVPFYGKQLMEYSDQSLWRAGLNFRFRFLKKFYATARGNVGQLSGQWFDGIIGNEILYGGGASLGYNSYIGPLEISYNQSYKGEPIFFLNLGFRF